MTGSDLFQFWTKKLEQPILNTPLRLPTFLQKRQKQVRDRLQISLLIFNRFKRINQILFPLKLSENRDFRGIGSSLIRLNLLWKHSLKKKKTKDKE